MEWTEIASGQTNRAFQQFMSALGNEADVAVIKLEYSGNRNNPTSVKIFGIDGDLLRNARKN